MSTSALLRMSVFGFSVFLVSCLTGCASPEGTRLYAGAVRAADQVALILSADGATRVHRVEARGGQPAMMVATRPSFEVLPGHYSLFVAYIASDNSVGKGRDIAVDLKPGGVYVLYGKIDYAQKTWHPVFVEMLAYQQDDCGGGCADRKELQALADQHFRGERRAMTRRSWGGWQ
jgi:hypothetical protein